jgi:hypothetical protein
MTTDQRTEVAQILELQSQISERLKKLGFAGDPEAIGNITHHLAETAVFGKRLASEILPALLNLPLDQRKEIGELVVDLQYELSELRESLENMEPALVKLMNFLTE